MEEILEFKVCSYWKSFLIIFDLFMLLETFYLFGGKHFLSFFSYSCWWKIFFFIFIYCGNHSQWKPFFFQVKGFFSFFFLSLLLETLFLSSLKYFSHFSHIPAGESHFSIWWKTFILLFNLFLLVETIFLSSRISFFIHFCRFMLAETISLSSGEHIFGLSSYFCLWKPLFI